MNNQWKMVPVEPTDEMIEAVEHDQYTFATGDEEWIGCVSEDMAREIYTNMLAAAPVPPADLRCYGENCTAGAWPNSDDHSAECLNEAAKSQGWDMPPAGDVEVDGLISVMRNAVRDDANNGGPECFAKAQDAENAVHANVTRLTAERDGLQSLYDDTQARLIASMKDAKRMESELTKARELITDIRGADRAYATQKINTYLAHQSAPPAKGGKCWSCKQPVTTAQWQEADGNCPQCGVEIEDTEGLKP